MIANRNRVFNAGKGNSLGRGKVELNKTRKTRFLQVNRSTLALEYMNAERYVWCVQKPNAPYGD